MMLTRHGERRFRLRLTCLHISAQLLQKSEVGDRHRLTEGVWEFVRHPRACQTTFERLLRETQAPQSGRMHPLRHRVIINSCQGVQLLDGAVISSRENLLK